MNKESYNPIWPETLIFLGAGATASIGMPTTGKIAELLYKLSSSDGNLASRVESVFKDKTFQKEIGDFFEQLNDIENNNQTGKYSKNLRNNYSWATLKSLISICPGESEKDFKLLDLFNIIDLHLNNGQGFHTPNAEGEKVFIDLNSLRKARNTLKLLINLIFAYKYQLALKNNRNTIDKYAQFADILAEMMLDEGEYFSSQNYSLDKRKFYLFSYAVISMNWDPLFLWYIFNAHKKKNDSPLKIGESGVELKLFNDFAHFLGVRAVDSKEQKIWYPLNETVVQRLNDPEYQNRRVRVGKYYFPHGSLNWRNCPKCGKLTSYLGSEWDIYSESLFPPQLVKNLSFSQPRSKEEFNDFKVDLVDSLQCQYCGKLTSISDSPMIMQSSFKLNHSSFIEEIQRDMRIAIEEAKHILLFGYSLPEDDVIYRSLLAARKKYSDQENIPYCSVATGRIADAPNKWLKGRELEEFLNKNPESSFAEVVKIAFDIFGKDNVRGYACGIPAVFMDKYGGHASKARIKELLYPKKIFSNNRVER